MKKKAYSTRGSITVEACIALTLFMFLILTLYSFFYIFEAQMKIQSNLIRTAESLSIDPFVSTRVDSKVLGSDASLGDLFASFAVDAFTNNSDFMSEDDWYSETDEANKSLQKVAETRFTAMYNGGDQSGMTESLSNLRVKDGNVKLKATVKDGVLTLEATYELKYLFDYPAFKMPNLKMKQSAVSRIWK
jgi:hypothetical protein